jgi:aminopeptidase N
VRWDSAQALATRVIGEVEAQLIAGETPVVDALLVEACGELLQDEALDPALVAEMLRLPSEDYLAELASQGGGANVDTIHRARNIVRNALGVALAHTLLARYQRLENPMPYAPDGEQIAMRSLRNTCLAYLVSADPTNIALAVKQYRAATNMTDRLAALKEIAFYGDSALRDNTLEAFYHDWRHEALVVNQWLQLQAAIPDEQALSRVQALLFHAEFDLRNPNKVRALVGGFANQNPINFHRLDGAGYRFLSDIVIQLNRLNPQVAARLLTPLTKWRNYTGRAQLMCAELERLAAEPALSPDVYEVVTKSLR